jgi:tRNA pseudouridine32 synthase/23S rRNA pseudouridine746 synthase
LNTTQDKNSPEKQRFHQRIVYDQAFFEDLKDNTAASVLTHGTGLSKQKIKKTMQHGAIWLTRGKQNKRLRRASKALQENDQIDIYFDDALLSLKLEAPTLIEDLGDYSVWYKPYGILSQGSKWGDFHTINRFAELNLKPQRTAFIVHRLDRAACGLILLAHKKSAAAKLSTLFAERKIEKHYLAITENKFSEKVIECNSPIEDKPAKSSFSAISYRSENNTSLVSAKIETGRKHQIRIHLSELGFPIKGDRLYGNAGKNDINLQLCSVFLGFQCPITNENKQFHLPEQLRTKL